MNILDLFSGIGGFSLGFLSANFKDYDFSKLPNEQQSKSDEFFKTIAFCEIESVCHKILNRHYPGIKIYDDVTKITKQDLENQKIDIITGGFPCQDLSIAGKMAGLNGKRSGLFYEMLRITEFTKPKYILFENTPELIRNKNYFGIFTQELRLRGYEYRAFLLRADFKGHKRQRAYILANAAEVRPVCVERIFTLTADVTQQNAPAEIIPIYHRYLWRKKNGYENDLPDIRKDDGVSSGLHRVGMLGNSVVPELVSIFAKAIKENEC